MLGTHPRWDSRGPETAEARVGACLLNPGLGSGVAHPEVKEAGSLHPWTLTPPGKTLPLSGLLASDMKAVSVGPSPLQLRR